MALEFFQTILRKRKRYIRHAASLVRYSSIYKLRNLIRVEWDRLRKREIVTGLPYVMVLDPTNVCNLKCPICPTTRGQLLQPSGRITVENFTDLVDPAGVVKDPLCGGRFSGINVSNDPDISNIFFFKNPFLHYF